MNSYNVKTLEKINNGNITANNNGSLEFSLNIKREELEKFFNSYLHKIDKKNKDKDILLVSSNEKSVFLLQEIKNILTHFSQSISITTPSTLGMAKMLVKNNSFRELIYVFLDEKTQTLKLILTKNKREIDGQNLFNIMQKINLFYPRSFQISPCNYIKNDVDYKKEIVSLINSIYLTIKNDEVPPKIEKKIFFKTENSFIKNETPKLFSPFGLEISEEKENACFVFEIDSSGEKIEKILYKNQVLDRDLYLRYLYQKKIRKNLKIYIKNKNLYFLNNNLPIISRFGKKIKDVLCETYLFVMLSETKAFLEYSKRNNSSLT